MDPLTLLKEIFGEETVRKIVTSGFDSVGKIAAATPDSLSYFTGLPEGLTAQVIQTAERALGGPASGAEESRPPEPIRPRRNPPRNALPRKPARRKRNRPTEEPGPEPDPTEAEDDAGVPGGVEDSEVLDSLLLDEDPLLDAGGVLKTFAARSQPREVFDDPDDILSEVGLTGAEAAFLEGIPSPWPNVPPPEEGSIPVLLAPPEPVRAESPAPVRTKEIELAAVTDWSWEQEPDPVPRIVRAAELGPDPAPDRPEAPRRSRKPESGPTAAAARRSESPASRSKEPERTIAPGPAASSPEKDEAAPPAPRRSFWRFGR